MKKLRVLASTALSAALVLSAIPVSASNTANEVKDKASPLIVTEVVTTGPTNSRFTYAELFNNADKSLDMKDYHFYYTYPDGTCKDFSTNGTSISVASGKAIVFWLSDQKAKNGQGNTVDDFNRYYGVNLKENQDIYRVNYSSIHATEKRGFLFGRDHSAVVAEAWCNDKAADLPTGNPQKLGIEYQYSENGQTSEKSGIEKATPGSVAASQVPQNRTHISADNTVKPSIDAVQAKGTVKNTGLTVNAQITVPQNTTYGAVRAFLYYRQKNASLEYQSFWKQVPMTLGKDGTYQAAVDRSKFWGTETQWYVQAGYSTEQSAKSEVQSSQIEEPDNLTESKKAPLVVTEVSPNPSADAVGGQYTYMELYNCSDSDINLARYKLFYYYDYPNKTAAQSGKIWTVSTPEAVVKPGKAVVLWLSSGGTTAAQFNQHYGTQLKENEELFRVNYPGFHDTAARWIRLGTTEENAFTVAGFNENSEELISKNSGESLQYSFPRTDAGIAIPVTRSKSSPGTVEPWQIPSYTVKFTGYPALEGYPKDDGQKPTLKLSSGFTIPQSIHAGEQIYELFDVDNMLGATSAERYAAIERDQGKAMRPYLIGTTINYKLDNETEWHQINEKTQWRLGKFAAQIPSDILFGHSKVTFNVVAYSLYSKNQTPDYTVAIINPNNTEGKVRLNVNNSVISGQKVITANDGTGNQATKIFVDGKELNTVPALEDGAYFSVKTSGVDSYFKDALTAPYGGNARDIIHIYYAWCESPASSVVKIDSKYFQHEDGKYKVKLTLWAGDSGTPFEEIYNEVKNENHEDYNVTQLRLRLLNGKDYLPVKIEPNNAKTNTSTAFDAVHTIGDSAGMVTHLDMYYEIPDSEVTAVGAAVDTTKLADGTHIVRAVSGDQTTETKVTVDNTAPDISFNLKDSSTQYQPIALMPQVKDNGTVTKTTMTLDGQPVTTPYTIVPQDMTVGEHTAVVTAVDGAGNTAAKTLKFSTAADASALHGSTRDVTSGSANLTVSVDGGKSNVAFLQGKSLTTANGGVTDASAGTNNGFPCMTYTLHTGNVQADDTISVNWKGTAANEDSSHSTNTYVKNLQTGKWDRVGGKSAAFAAKNYVTAGKASLMIQCRTNGTAPADSVAAAPLKTAAASAWDGTRIPDSYDFSFAWETDTQYYAESFPYHYTNMNRWIVDNRNRLKTKYVIHTGDIVDDCDYTGEWENADKAMKIFDDAKMPYGVLGGNHDVYAGAENYGNYWKYFGEERFNRNSWYGGSYKNNLGHYDLLTENGQDMIVLYMSWDIYKDEIQWMNDILAKYPNRKAILCFHRYTGVQLSDDILDYTGKIVREEVVKKNKNVIAVLNGHYHGSSIQTEAFDNGDGTKRTVYQICTDYQSDPEGGSEYIKYLYFDLKNNKIYINSYSPYRKDFNYYDTPKMANYGVGTKAVDQDIAELDVNFDKQPNALQTASISADVRTQRQIAVRQNVSGNVTAAWQGLSSGTQYGWYAKITDGQGAVTCTPVQSFQTTGSSSGTPSGGNVPSSASSDSDHKGGETNAAALTVKVADASGTFRAVTAQDVIELPLSMQMKVQIDADKTESLANLGFLSGNGVLLTTGTVQPWNGSHGIFSIQADGHTANVTAGTQVGVYAQGKLLFRAKYVNRPFDCDTSEDVALSGGKSYIFAVKPKAGQNMQDYTFWTANGTVLQTSLVKGAYPDANGRYLCRVKAKKPAGRVGIYCLVNGSIYRLFAVNCR